MVFTLAIFVCYVNHGAASVYRVLIQMRPSVPVACDAIDVMLMLSLLNLALLSSWASPGTYVVAASFARFVLMWGNSIGRMSAGFSL